jgi:hypothetical protein
MLVGAPEPACRILELMSRRLSCRHPATGNGTTASRVAPGRGGLVENRRAPSSGTAAQPTTIIGCSANPATSTGTRSTRAGGSAAGPGSCVTSSDASQGRLANRTHRHCRQVSICRFPARGSVAASPFPAFRGTHPGPPGQELGSSNPPGQQRHPGGRVGPPGPYRDHVTRSRYGCCATYSTSGGGSRLPLPRSTERGQHSGPGIVRPGCHPEPEHQPSPGRFPCPSSHSPRRCRP